MSRTLIGVGITIIAIIVVGAIVLAGQQDGNPSTINDGHTGNESTKQSNLDTSTDKQQEQNASNQAVQTTTVDIKDFAYTPTKIQVKKGTTVTWINQDTIGHDITPDRENDNFRASELLDKGETYTFTFNEAGTYTYHCSPHPYMKGTVEVIE